MSLSPGLGKISSCSDLGIQYSFFHFGILYLSSDLIILHSTTDLLHSKFFFALQEHFEGAKGVVRSILNKTMAIRKKIDKQ